MNTRTLLLGLLVAGGCRSNTADTASPADASESTNESKGPSEDHEMPTSMDEIDMDEIRNDGSEDEADPAAMEDEDEDEAEAELSDEDDDQDD